MPSSTWRRGDSNTVLRASTRTRRAISIATAEVAKTNIIARPGPSSAYIISTTATTGRTAWLS